MTQFRFVVCGHLFEIDVEGEDFIPFDVFSSEVIPELISFGISKLDAIESLVQSRQLFHFSSAASLTRKMYKLWDVREIRKLKKTYTLLRKTCNLQLADNGFVKFFVPLFSFLLH